MIREAIAHKITFLALTTLLISVIIIASIVAFSLIQPKTIPNNVRTIDQLDLTWATKKDFPVFDTLSFTTYTYGGYEVRQSESRQFCLIFPDKTNQGNLAGSDAITVNTYLINKVDFDAVFIAPKIRANGFDEMVVFAASDTITYKGVEFGARLSLSDGFIYGYIQEPNGKFGDVNFQMLKLVPNDAIIHHFSLEMLGSKVAFYIDGTNYGQLYYKSQLDFSNLNFSVLAVVHRFTDNWDSSGDSMTVANFVLNQ